MERRRTRVRFPAPPPPARQPRPPPGGRGCRVSAPAALTALPAELAGLTALRTLTGLDEEPLMDPAFLEADPGHWSVDAQRLLTVYSSSPHGFGRG